MAKGFTLNNGRGAWLDVEAVHLISPSRCCCSGTHGSVVIGQVMVGIFQTGDKIVLQNKSGAELIDDIVARLEINCEQCSEVSRGSRVGMLLKQHTPGELLKFGLPRHLPHRPPTAHPHRM